MAIFSIFLVKKLTIRNHNDTCGIMNSMKKYIKKLQEIGFSSKRNRKNLEKKVVEGADKAVKEYKHVFERLAQYDRA